MPIKTVSIETAKLLKENGFRQDTDYAYNDVELLEVRGNPYCEYFDRYYCSWYKIKNGLQCYSAPTTDELLEELPYLIKFFDGDIGATLSINLDENPTTSNRQWFCYYAKHFNHVSICHCELNELLPEALALMWLHLRKEGLI